MRVLPLLKTGSSDLDTSPILVVEWLAREVGERLGITDEHELALLRGAMARNMRFVSADRRSYEFKDDLRVSALRRYARHLAVHGRPQAAYDFLAEQLQRNAVYGYCTYIGYNLLGVLGVEVEQSAERDVYVPYWNSEWGVGVVFALRAPATTTNQYYLAISVPPAYAERAIAVNLTSRTLSLTVNPFPVEIRIIRHDVTRNNYQEVHRESVVKHANKNTMQEVAMHLRRALTPIGAQPPAILRNLIHIIFEETFELYKEQLYDCILREAFANSPYITVTNEQFYRRMEKDNKMVIHLSFTVNCTARHSGDVFIDVLPQLGVKFAIVTTLLSEGRKIRGSVEGSAELVCENTHIGRFYYSAAPAQMIGVVPQYDAPPRIHMEANFSVDSNIPTTDIMSGVTEHGLRLCKELSVAVRAKYNIIPLLAAAQPITDSDFGERLLRALMDYIVVRDAKAELGAFVRAPLAGMYPFYYSIVTYAKLGEDVSVSVVADLKIVLLTLYAFPPQLVVQLNDADIRLRVYVPQTQDVDLREDAKCELAGELIMPLRAYEPISIAFLTALRRSGVLAKLGRAISELLNKGIEYCRAHMSR